MTEEEAKTKWCPMVRSLCVSADGSGGAIGANRASGSIENSLCIGSACMMWRRDEEVTEHGYVSYRRSDTDGYCGLAGKP